MIYLVGGGNLRLRQDWRDFTRAPEAPANYKDPLKIEAYVQQKLETLEDEIMASTMALLEVVNPKFEYCGSTDEPFYSEMPLDRFAELVTKNDVTFVGSKAIMYSVFCHPWDYDDAPTKHIRQAILTGKIKFITLEEMLFSSGDRRLLLIDKLLPERKSDESGIDYTKRVLDLYSITNGDWHKI